MTGLSERLQQRMEASGLTQRELAELVSVSQPIVSHWCSGRRQPKSGHLEKLAHALGVSVDWLRDGRGPATPDSIGPRAAKLAPNGLGWAFRPTPPDRGRDYGNANVWSFNPDLSTFVREVLQNILDNPIARGLPVGVRFRLIRLSGSRLEKFRKSIAWGTLSRHLEASAQSGQKLGGLLRTALDKARADGELLILAIEETGTKGLLGPETGSGNFAALCRNNLDSKKDGPAGGSFGLGKAVLWRCSEFSTVIFHSSLSSPELGQGTSRLIGRTELTWHQVDSSAFAGPGWFGAMESQRPNAISVWDDPALASDLCLGRPVGEPGTTIGVVGFHDPTSDKDLSPRELATQIEEAVAKNFWPAIVDGLLTAHVEIRHNDEELYHAEVAAEQLQPQFCDLLQSYREGTLVDVPKEIGDCSSVEIPITVPARKDQTLGESEHAAKLLVRRSDSEDPSAFSLSVFRGPRMVVRYHNLENIALGAWPFHAALVCGEAVQKGEEAAEDFLRAAEPPSHDDWVPTPDLSAHYARGCVKTLREFIQRAKQELRNMVKPVTPDTGDGPSSIKELFRIGNEPPKSPERPRISSISGFVDDDGAWVVNASVRVKPKPTGFRITPVVVFSADTGFGATVQWQELEALHCCSVDGGDLLTEPGKREIKFRGRTNPGSHPVPSANFERSSRFAKSGGT